MYYYDEVLTSIEDLLMDFLSYRKSQKPLIQSNVPIQEEIQKNCHYKNFQQNLKITEIPEEYAITQPIPTNVKKLIDAFPKPLDTLPPEIEEGTDDEYMHLLLGEINSKLMPYVMEVLNSYEYTGSPIFDEQIDRETIAQIIDKVLERAQEEIPEVDEIQTEPERQTWVRYRLLRAIAEALVLSELFLRRRPVYRVIKVDSL